MIPRPHRRAPAPSRDRWVLPYADFVTLLFAFFTALYAATAVDARRLHEIAEGVREATGRGAEPGPSMAGAGLLSANTALLPETPPATPPPTPAAPEVREALARALSEDLRELRLEMIEERRGTVLAIPEAFAFSSGGAELSGEAKAFMHRIGEALSRMPNAVRVEGHTDPTPISTPRFASNWELSIARATTVVALFIVDVGIDPARLSAAGYSEYHPRAGNDTAAGRARNRRVDIVILNAATAEAEEPLRRDPS